MWYIWKPLCLDALFFTSIQYNSNIKRYIDQHKIYTRRVRLLHICPTAQCVHYKTVCRLDDGAADDDAVVIAPCWGFQTISQMQTGTRSSQALTANANGICVHNYTRSCRVLLIRMHPMTSIMLIMFVWFIINISYIYIWLGRKHLLAQYRWSRINW